MSMVTIGETDYTVHPPVGHPSDNDRIVTYTVLAHGPHDPYWKVLQTCHTRADADTALAEIVATSKLPAVVAEPATVAEVTADVPAEPVAEPAAEVVAPPPVAEPETAPGPAEVAAPVKPKRERKSKTADGGRAHFVEIDGPVVEAPQPKVKPPKTVKPPAKVVQASMF